MYYTATQWNTAEDKEKFAAHFKRFVEKDFPETMFNKGFYNRMSMMRGHIAHYNQSGFYDAQFSTSQRRTDFLRQWTRSPIYGDPEYTWSDVEQVLAAWLKEHPEYEQRERNAHNAYIERTDRAELSRLTAKYINA